MKTKNLINPLSINNQIWIHLNDKIQIWNQIIDQTQNQIETQTTPIIVQIIRQIKG